MRLELRDLALGTVGPLNYPRRGPQSPEAQSPRAKAKSRKSKGTIERGTDHAHGLEARWRITYYKCIKWYNINPRLS